MNLHFRAVVCVSPMLETNAKKARDRGGESSYRGKLFTSASQLPGDEFEAVKKAIKEGGFIKTEIEPFKIQGKPVAMTFIMDDEKYGEHESIFDRYLGVSHRTNWQKARMGIADYIRLILTNKDFNDPEVGVFYLDC